MCAILGTTNAAMSVAFSNAASSSVGLLAHVSLAHPNQHGDVDARGFGRHDSGQDQLGGETGKGDASPDRSRFPHRMPAGEISLDECLGNVFPEEGVAPIRSLGK